MCERFKKMRATLKSLCISLLHNGYQPFELFTMGY